MHHAILWATEEQRNRTISCPRSAVFSTLNRATSKSIPRTRFQCTATGRPRTKLSPKKVLNSGGKNCVYRFYYGFSAKLFCKKQKHSFFTLNLNKNTCWYLILFLAWCLYLVSNFSDNLFLIILNQIKQEVKAQIRQHVRGWSRSQQSAHSARIHDKERKTIDQAKRKRVFI